MLNSAEVAVSTEEPKDTMVRKLGLIDFSGDENFSPEIIDDALKSTATFHANVDIAAIAQQIKDNKAKYGSTA